MWKKAIISHTSSNSNKNEECGGEKEELNFDFTIHESCSADKNMQCDLQKNKIEKLQKELIAYKDELIEGTKRFISCVKKTIHLKPVNFHISILKSQMTKWYFLQDLIVPDLYGCSTKQKVASKSYISYH